MTRHSQIEQRCLTGKIKRGEIAFAGNRKLKIFGTLRCRSGKRMKKQNRVFFESEAEAIEWGYRPCGHCMKEAYEKWESSLVK